MKLLSMNGTDIDLNSRTPQCIISGNNNDDMDCLVNRMIETIKQTGGGNVNLHVLNNFNNSSFDILRGGMNGYFRRRFEVLIRRITAVARFCGIHLVMTTNIISADTITSTIKNNIPTTIALAVSNEIQGRIALDHDGAEKLSGEDDMLYYRTDLQQPIRIQGVLCGPNNDLADKLKGVN